MIEKTFFRRWTLAATLALGCLLDVSASAQEPTDDPNDGLTIEGDSAVFLQAQNSIEYSGNVVAFMNGLRINGDRVLVQMSNDRVERVTTSGQPASFWQEHSGRSQGHHRQGGDHRLPAKLWTAGAFGKRIIDPRKQ